MQAQEDARLAAAAYATQPAAGAADAARLLVPVPGRAAVQALVGGAAGAYLRLGEALMALPGHPDRDAAGAAQVGPCGQQCSVGALPAALLLCAEHVPRMHRSDVMRDQLRHTAQLCS